MKNILSFLLCLAASFAAISQSNIQQATSINADGAAPAASAMLDVSATDKGILVPRMTTAQRMAIASPATGLMVFDTDAGCFCFYNGGAWTQLGLAYTAGTGISLAGNIITNTGDPNAADDLTTGTPAGGDLAGTYPNPTIPANAIDSAQITNGSIAAADLGQMGAAAGQMLEWTGSAWAPGSVSVLQDADGDTKVQVEESPDEDIIRFDLGGTENMVLRKNGSGVPRLELKGSNTYIGESAGENGGYCCNTGVGYLALKANSIGYFNTAVGGGAMISNISGIGNTVSGNGAMSYNTTGNYNTVSGFEALYSNTTGYYNTAIGTYAMNANYAGFGNTAVGTTALANNFDGNQNTAVGDGALAGNYSGISNTGIGYVAGVSADSLTNATAIGYNAKVGCSNCLVLGGTGSDAVKVGIGTTSPAASALLDMQATDKGMLVPRMTSAQRTAIASPATGLLVFDTTSGGFWFFNGTAWANLAAPANTLVLQDADGDTKIQVEESPDEDIIRFDLGGTENMVLRKNMDGAARLELPDISFNTSIGQEAGVNNISTNGEATENTFLGYQAGKDNSMGDGNTFLGSLAGKSNSIGVYNTAVGCYAFQNNTWGEYNVASGVGALYSNTSGFNNVASGHGALYSNTFGGYNTASGASALSSNTAGYRNTASGQSAMEYNSTGSGNTASGDFVLRFNTTGNDNTAIGTKALYRNTTRSNLVAVGDSSLFNNGMGATAANHATANTALGSKALFANTTGYYNTASGYRALYSNTIGSHNTANGYQALYSSTTGVGNTAMGTNALFSNTTGVSNTANGAAALYANTTGLLNTANGASALFSNTTGNNNTANGNEALYHALNSGNTATGSSAGTDSDYSTNCSYIGYDADNDLAASTYSNSTALGYGSRITASDQVRVGNGSVTSIGGFQNWTNFSDGRFKKDVRENVPGLAFIQKLRPVTYHLDAHGLAKHLNEDVKDARGDQTLQAAAEADRLARDEKAAVLETGFIAQEVEAAAKELGWGFSGVDAPASERGLYGLRYAEFVVPLVKAVQEQQAVIEELRAENAAQKAQLQKITNALQTAGIQVEN